MFLMVFFCLSLLGLSVCLSVCLLHLTHTRMHRCLSRSLALSFIPQLHARVCQESLFYLFIVVCLVSLSHSPAQRGGAGLERWRTVVAECTRYAHPPTHPAVVERVTKALYHCCPLLPSPLPYISVFICIFVLSVMLSLGETGLEHPGWKR